MHNTIFVHLPANTGLAEKKSALLPTGRLLCCNRPTNNHLGRSIERAGNGPAESAEVRFAQSQLYPISIFQGPSYYTIRRSKSKAKNRPHRSWLFPAPDAQAKTKESKATMHGQPHFVSGQERALVTRKKVFRQNTIYLYWRPLVAGFTGKYLDVPGEPRLPDILPARQLRRLAVREYCQKICKCPVKTAKFCCKTGQLRINSEPTEGWRRSQEA